VYRNAGRTPFALESSVQIYFQIQAVVHFVSLPKLLFVSHLLLTC
jgi:hypothetical protein